MPYLSHSAVVIHTKRRYIKCMHLYLIRVFILCYLLSFLIIHVYFTCVILCTDLVYYCHQLEAIIFFLMILFHIDLFNADLKYITKLRS